MSDDCKSSEWNSVLFIIFNIWSQRPYPSAWTQGVMNFKIKVEGFIDIIIMHFVYFPLLEKKTDNGYIGPTLEPEPHTQWPCNLQFS